MFSCPKCKAKIEEDEIHSCTGPSYYAPGLLALLKQVLGVKYETPRPKAAGREKRG